ncbi:hypothetical protein [Nostoc sp. DedQUE02]|uniref:hypothetical protein n=1 Tax=Nostoc sp. DedQUE02 TaxID=3075388 RepID=UPI002AD3D099|nr:hypothetical protein [Nostoc sp. DedQUE03]MDZ7974144.1 hypothetical protein [Nostoc sp. DedQUE03]MDZ8042961.1 hypothetical protein [Nostoc sp. DedQUE02]
MLDRSCSELGTSTFLLGRSCSELETPRSELRSHFFFSERSHLPLHLSLESLDTTNSELRSHL